MKKNLFLGTAFAAIFVGANALAYGQTTIKAKQTSPAAVAAKKPNGKKPDAKEKKLVKKQRSENMKSERTMEKEDATTAKNTGHKKRKRFLGIF